MRHSLPHLHPAAWWAMVILNRVRDRRTGAKLTTGRSGSDDKTASPPLSRELQAGF
jgi:hypothetical protein